MKNNFVIYVVCFIVGILFFTVLPNICGCNVTEGQNGNKTCEDWDGTCDEGTTKKDNETTCSDAECTKEECCSSPPSPPSPPPPTTEDFENSELIKLGLY